MPKRNATKSPKELDLLAYFSAANYQIWREAAEDLLAEAPFEEALSTDTYENIRLKPLFVSEDVEDFSFFDTKPGFAPFVRGGRASGFRRQAWHVAQDIPVKSAGEFNQILRRALQRGLTAVTLKPDKSRAAAPRIQSLQDFEAALNNVDLTNVPIFIDVRLTGLAFAAYLIAFCNKRQFPLDRISGCIGFDPLAELAVTGSLPTRMENIYDDMRALTGWAVEAAPQLKTISVDATPYHDAGASAVQELACAMATGVEYLRSLLAKDGANSIEDLAPRIRFSFSLGENLFMEIAKLRAARLLWHQVVTAFGASEDKGRMTLHAQTSWRSLTVYDPYINMLRATTQTLAGVLGGCDSLCVLPFDAVFAQSNEFSRRVARNVHLILREEAHLDKVIDPAAGSWYVESLTKQLAEKTWQTFQEIEVDGGMHAALISGLIQEKIAKTAAHRFENLATREDKIVGVNAYPNPDEAGPGFDAQAHSGEGENGEPKEQPQSSLAALKKAGAATPTVLTNACVQAAEDGASPLEIFTAVHSGRLHPTTVTALTLRRTAAPFEHLRQTLESFRKANPTTESDVFLVTIGEAGQLRARIDFATEFFQIAGLRVYASPGYRDATEASQAALDSSARTVVLCAKDKTYPEVVPPFTKAVKSQRPDTLVLVAGEPREYAEAFKAAGVNEFIYPGCDVYQTLRRTLTEIGILNES